MFKNLLLHLVGGFCEFPLLLVPFAIIVMFLNYTYNMET